MGQTARNKMEWNPSVEYPIPFAIVWIHIFVCTGFFFLFFSFLRFYSDLFGRFRSLFWTECWMRCDRTLMMKKHTVKTPFWHLSFSTLFIFLPAFLMIITHWQFCLDVSSLVYLCMRPFTDNFFTQQNSLIGCEGWDGGGVLVGG